MNDTIRYHQVVHKSFAIIVSNNKQEFKKSNWSN